MYLPWNFSRSINSLFIFVTVFHAAFIQFHSLNCIACILSYYLLTPYFICDFTLNSFITPNSYHLCWCI